MSRVLLEFLEERIFGRPDDVVDLVNLVQLVVAREERVERNDLEEHAADAPQVHLVAIVAVGQQALGRAVPPRADVLRVRLFAVNPAATTEICEFHAVVHYQNILRLNVPMENAVPVHVIDRLQQLIHVVLDSIFRQVVSAALYGIVEIHVHQLKHECETPSRLIVQDFIQFDNLWVGRQSPQRLDLS